MLSAEDMLLAQPVGYQFARPNEAVSRRGAWWDYIVTQDEVYLLAARDGLSVCLPWSWHTRPLRGLAADLEPFVHLACGRIPASDLERLRMDAQTPLGAQFREALYYLVLNQSGGRTWLKPPQRQLCGHVEPLQQLAEYADAVLELHTHPPGCRDFSGGDDADEHGFRVYCILEGVDGVAPTLVCRVSVFGQHCPIPAAWVFELPEGWRDANARAITSEEGSHAHCKGNTPC